MNLTTDDFLEILEDYEMSLIAFIELYNIWNCYSAEKKKETFSKFNVRIFNSYK